MPDEPPVLDPRLHTVDVRFALYDGYSGTNLKFTIRLGFMIVPRVGDTIVLDGFYAVVKNVAHFVDINAVLVITDRISYDQDTKDRNDFLADLDKIKAKHVLLDIENDKPPESYYTMYRLLVRLIGSDKIDAISDIKLIAETCRTVLLAEIVGDDTSVDNIMSASLCLNPTIEKLHNLILRCRSFNNKLIDVIREFEKHINTDNRFKWAASDDVYRRIGLIVFSKIKSLQVSPKFLGL